MAIRETFSKCRPNGVRRRPAQGEASRDFDKLCTDVEPNPQALPQRDLEYQVFMRCRIRPNAAGK